MQSSGKKHLYSDQFDAQFKACHPVECEGFVPLDSGGNATKFAPCRAQKVIV